MRTCRKLEKYLSRGRFGDRLSALPEAMLHHIDMCSECRDQWERFVGLEDEFFRMEESARVDEPSVLSARTAARIRQGVDASIARRKIRVEIPGGVIAIPEKVYRVGLVGMACLMIVVVALHLTSQPNDKQARAVSRPAQEILHATWDADTIDAIWNQTEPEIYASSMAFNDDADLTEVLADLKDQDVMQAASDVLPYGGEWVLDDDLLESVSDLADHEWDALRRFLS